MENIGIMTTSFWSNRMKGWNRMNGIHPLWCDISVLKEPSSIH